MGKAQVLQEIRLMRFEEVYNLRRQKRVTVEQAAELLNVHERTLRRWVQRYKEQVVFYDYVSGLV